MKTGKPLLWAALLLIVFASCKKDKESNPEIESLKTEKLVSATKATTTPYNCGAFCNPPTVTYELPQDACSLSQQTTLNCFAWSTFLALNWKCSAARGIADSTATAASYGTPGDYSPTVWESFLSLEEVFTDHGPTPWNGRNMKKGGFVKKMHMLSKIENTLQKVNKRVLKAANSDVQELFQAHGTWLTDQAGNLVWYEVKMNVDEYNFITQNELYDPTKQLPYAEKNKGLWLPGGPSQYGSEGAMELKAAWKVVDADSVDAIKPYYKISQAMVPAVTGFDSNGQPILGQYSKQYLALVGLHIIRKTNLAHQLVWMTFEHIDNAPTEGQVDTNKKYSFYNKNSTATPNQSPNPKTDKITTPVQVMRIAANALDQDLIDINAYCQNLIKESNPNSVWQYYQLVNVQWPQNPIEDIANNNGQVPLNQGGITPTNIANTTMETYAQQDFCMQCHQYAGISQSQSTKWASDYSFIFSQAVPQKTSSKKL